MMIDNVLRKTLVAFVILLIIGTYVGPVIALHQHNDLSPGATTSTNGFYFVHITDTHVLHKIFDRNEFRKNRLQTVLTHVTSFKEKPAFVVITGDLVEWGSGLGGALNYQEFTECFYEKEGQLYADSNCTIPVYTTPGNHDYFWSRTLFNYHRFVDKKHVRENDRYTVTFNGLTLFFLDSGHNEINREAKPYDWIYVLGSGLSLRDIEWLDDALNSCTSQHKIVIMHHPAINWGEYDVIAHNREAFISLCEGYNVDLVLTGHTHAARVFDSNGNFYPNNVLPLNLSFYPTLYVQTDAIKEGYYYRNITISSGSIWLGPCEQCCETFFDS